jgi:hypothetical protein
VLNIECDRLGRYHLHRLIERFPGTRALARPDGDLSPATAPRKRIARIAPAANSPTRKI